MLAMMQELTIALVQTAAQPGFDVRRFGDRLAELVAQDPDVELWAFPELHLESAVPDVGSDTVGRGLDDEKVSALGGIAQRLGIWLVPGTMHERGEDGKIYNTAMVFSPEGERVATYRKIFPWRPVEHSAPGDSFEVFDIPGRGRIGLSICYDIWFPEHSRQLAWMGADLILNLVLTGTPDREQELAIVRGNAIMNQIWIASVNAASPTGLGQSLLVDPSGVVRASTEDAAERVLTARVDLAEPARVRAHGTAGVTRPWSVFRTGDRPVSLPLYGGHIDPSHWQPRSKENS